MFSIAFSSPFAKTRYTVGLLKQRALAIVLADSPLACIHTAKVAFFSSSALDRPMDCPCPTRFHLLLPGAHGPTPAPAQPDSPVRLRSSDPLRRRIDAFSQ
jgi:hypothetical protein